MKYSNVFEKVVNNHFFMNIFIGGRGIGKSYSILNESRKNHIPIIYMRTTDETIRLVCSESGNPYKSINLNEGCDVHIQMKGSRIIIDNKHDNPDDPDEVTDNEILGYGYSLSTFYKLRGTEFPEVKILYYDEFLEQEKNARKYISPSAFFQAIETIQRNRELEGGEPLKVVLTANSFTLDNDILRYLNLVDVIREMYLNNKHVWTDSDRSIYIELLDNKSVSNLKKNTALYKLTKGTSFYDMALDNEFTDDVFGDVRKIKFNEFTPICSISSVTFYSHKTKDIIIASSRKAQCKSYTPATIKGFMKDYGYMLRKYKDYGQMLYTSYDIKLKVYDILK